jgi:predicted RNase H-like HicB family nuclease
MRYKVNLKKTEEGYSVWVPGLPGCWSQGKTEEEALDNIKDAIQAYTETGIPFGSIEIDFHKTP